MGGGGPAGGCVVCAFVHTHVSDVQQRLGDVKTLLKTTRECQSGKLYGVVWRVVRGERVQFACVNVCVFGIGVGVGVRVCACACALVRSALTVCAL